MKKFKCVVKRVDVYEIEIDDTKLGEEWLKKLQLSNNDLKDYDDHASNIAFQRSIYGKEFFEEYGYVNIDGIGPSPEECCEGKYEPNINIEIIEEDDVDVDIELIEEDDIEEIE